MFTKLGIAAVLAATLAAATPVAAESFAPTAAGYCGGMGNGTAERCGNYVDANGDGVCDLRGTGQGTGAHCGNFVDANGDGVCDQKGTGQGTGSQYHSGCCRRAAA